MLLAWILPGFSIESWSGGLALAALLGLLNALVWPFLIRIALPLTVITLGIGVLVLNGLFVWLASDLLSSQIDIRGLWTAIVVAIGLTLVNNLVTLFLGIDDDDLYYRQVIKRQAQRKGHAAAPSDVPGVLFLEIDGLAHDVLVRAMRDGSAPTMARWLRNGSHSIVEWECDWSSQTGAMQSGILQGSNWDMPGFRWWEKDRQAAFVSNSPKNAAEIEQRHTNGKGLLYEDGASRANLVSGDAPHSMITMSTVLEKRKGRLGEDYFAFFANPYDVTRTFILVVKEIVAELWQQTQQKRQDIEPRVHRGWFPYPLLRSYTNVLQRELEVASTIQDLYSGRPVIYTMFLGYDEVAHHSGIERPETLRELAKIDKAFSRLARAAADASRPYQIVVLADHGQSQGATFSQRNSGRPLADVVSTLIGSDEVLAPGGVDEGWGYLNAATTEVAQASGAVGTVVRGVTGGAKADDGSVNMGATRDESGRKRRREEKRGQEGAPEVTVMASGCLGLVSFPRIEGRATLEQLNEQYPKLVDGLRTHPGIGFLLVRSEEHGAVVLGPSGTNYLDEGRVEGEDPLAPYGPNAALHVKRTDTFPHCQDIMLNSTYWTDVDEVAAFEELCGSHGGMGGTQSRPFILYPAGLPAPHHKIVGAENVHRQFVDWLVQLGHTAYADLPEVPNRLVVPRAGDEVATMAAPVSNHAADGAPALAEAGQ
jgi:uncharacterized membrane protein YvlD (DUF360 family)